MTYFFEVNGFKEPLAVFAVSLPLDYSKIFNIFLIEVFCFFVKISFEKSFKPS